MAPDYVEVTIHDIAYGGDGVARLDTGMVVFVPFAAAGDRLRVRLQAVKKRFARGVIDEVLTPGPGRVEPACPYFGRCGGCRYQHVADDQEVPLKAGQLHDLLQRLGKFAEPPAVETPAAECGPRWNYRNKVTMHPADGAPGFVAVDQQHVVPVSACPIARPEINEYLADAGPCEDDLTVRVDARGTCRRVTAASTATLTEELLGSPLQVPANAFYQVNPPVLDAACRWLQQALEPLAVNGLIDAYGGVGVFALALAKQCCMAVGIESHTAAVACARENAAAWGVDHAEFVAGAVEDELPRCLESAAEAAPCCLLLDPPRSGCSKKVLAALCHHTPDCLVYVSCAPDRLARDLQRITAETPLRLQRLAVFDMFPQTAHFETVAILTT